MHFDSIFMEIVERQLISYLMQAAIGTKKNYYKRLAQETKRVSFFGEMSADMYENSSVDEFALSDAAYSFKNETLEAV